MAAARRGSTHRAERHQFLFYSLSAHTFPADAFLIFFTKERINQTRRWRRWYGSDGEIERFIEKWRGRANWRAASQIDSSFLRLDFLISSKNGSTLQFVDFGCELSP